MEGVGGGGGGGSGGGRGELIKKEATAEGDDADNEEEELIEDNKKISGSNGGGSGSGKKGLNSGGGGSSMRICQAERCTADLSDSKQYHRRHKVCEHHAKAQVVIVGGIRQRFCQQCSRFHELLEFDDAKRSCRRRLAEHNERRRKIAAESQAEGSSRKGEDTHQLKETACGQVDDNGRMQISIRGNTIYKHFQIK